MKNIPFKSALSLRLPAEVQRKRLHRVIRQELTEKQRIALIGYYFREMTIAEIAKEQGVCPSTVCRTLHRAEERIRRFLQY